MGGKSNSLYCFLRFNTPHCCINLWAANLIDHLWQFSTLLWIQRNECLHGKDAISKGTISDAALNDQIKHMFLTAQRSIHPEDAHLCLTPLEDRINQTTNQRHLWLKTVKVALKRSANSAENCTQQPRPAQNPESPPMREGRRPRVRLRP